MFHFFFGVVFTALQLHSSNEPTVEILKSFMDEEFREMDRKTAEEKLGILVSEIDNIIDMSDDIRIWESDTDTLLLNSFAKNSFNDLQKFALYYLKELVKKNPGPDDIDSTANSMIETTAFRQLIRNTPILPLKIQNLGNIDIELQTSAFSTLSPQLQGILKNLEVQFDEFYKFSGDPDTVLLISNTLKIIQGLSSIIDKIYTMVDAKKSTLTDLFLIKEIFRAFKVILPSSESLYNPNTISLKDKLGSIFHIFDLMLIQTKKLHHEEPNLGAFTDVSEGDVVTSPSVVTRLRGYANYIFG